MSLIYRLPWIVWALGMLILLCALVAGGAALSGQLLTAGAQRSLAAARARWAARPVAHYQMELTLDDNWAGSCRQVAEVRAEAVVAVEENTCQRALPTVSLLFDEIARDITKYEGTCGPNGCWCDGVWRVQADYDAQHGHPTQITIAISPVERYRYLGEILRTGGGCTLVGWVSPVMRITLTPLP